jgi:histidinol dehydrogenase
VEKGFACIAPNMDKAIELSDIIGPEHLEVQTSNSEGDGKRCNNYGALFVGKLSAEVLGDYGAGPNHVLPTSGTAKYTGGLSVFTFLRIRTWMNMTDKSEGQIVVSDAVALARVEGLEGHARAAECRLTGSDESPTKKAKK